jgi:N-acetylglutamate synthase-like GNAT family acetyltransferase
MRSLFVEEDNRGSGIGSDIVKRLVSKLRDERGAAALHNLYLLTLNGAAVLRFYKRLGFAEAAWSDVPATLKAECLIGSAGQFLFGNKVIAMQLVDASACELE